MSPSNNPTSMPSTLTNSPTPYPTTDTGSSFEFTLTLFGQFDHLADALNSTNITFTDWALNTVKIIINMNIYLGTYFDILIISVRQGSIIIDYKIVNVTNTDVFNQLISNVNSTTEIVDNISNVTYTITDNILITSEPTPSPSNNPTVTPTISPTNPSIAPTTYPSNSPTLKPTKHPLTANETHNPTNDPSNDPTSDPTYDPTNNPTSDPTFDPTNEPTTDPTFDPTIDPTNNPTLYPTQAPTAYSVYCNDGNTYKQLYDAEWEYNLTIAETSIVTFDTCDTLKLFDMFIKDEQYINKNYSCVRCGSICVERAQFTIVLAKGIYSLYINQEHAFKMKCKSTNSPTKSPITLSPTKT
eukprot:125525_1